jgi:hypothetical protein
VAPKRNDHSAEEVRCNLLCFAQCENEEPRVLRRAIDFTLSDLLARVPWRPLFISSADLTVELHQENLFHELYLV